MIHQRQKYLAPRSFQDILCYSFSNGGLTADQVKCDKIKKYNTFTENKSYLIFKEGKTVWTVSCHNFSHFDIFHRTELVFER